MKLGKDEMKIRCAHFSDLLTSTLRDDPSSLNEGDLRAISLRSSRKK